MANRPGRAKAVAAGVVGLLRSAKKASIGFIALRVQAIRITFYLYVVLHLKLIEYGVYGDPIIIYPKPYSIYI